jgi:hypothetical protein
MHNITTQLDLALRSAGLNIAGVSLGDHDDKTTWSCDFAGEAGPEDLAVAQGIIDSFSFDEDLAESYLVEQEFDPQHQEGKWEKLLMLLQLMMNEIRANNNQPALSTSEFIDLVKAL